MTTKQEERNFELTRKIYESYRFLVNNTGNNKAIRKKIDALAYEHLELY
jgi:hypothetical protein